MLACISDVCSFTIYASPFAFYHLYIDCNPPATHKETSMDGPSTDCKQSEPSHRVNNNEIRPEYLLTKAQAVRLRWDWKKKKDFWQVRRQRMGNEEIKPSLWFWFFKWFLQLTVFTEKHPASEVRSGGSRTPADLSAPFLGETSRDDDHPGPSHRVRSEHLLTRAAKSRLRGKKKKDFWTPRNWRQKED